MTAQIPDTLVLEDRELSICGVRVEGLFDPETVGLYPRGGGTACWRGYVCRYRIQDDRLVLDRLSLKLRDADKEKEINGVKPISGTGDVGIGDSVYEGLYLPVGFTGALLAGGGIIRPLMVNMGFQPAWRYDAAYEVILVDGRVIYRRDASARAGEIRKAILDGAEDPRMRTKGPDIRDYVDGCFNLDYDV